MSKLVLGCFVMMRNERAILGPFLDQLEEFFDHIVVLDHMSSDGSDEVVKARCNDRFRLYYLDSTGYPQSEVATRFCREVFETTPVDWMFFLDCDEFLPFESRAELEDRLCSIGEADISYMHWRNIVPIDLGGENIFSGRFATLPSVSETKKVAIRRSALVKCPRLQVWQGYHGVANASGLVHRCLSEVGLFHIPVQSRLRFVSKISMSARVLLAERTLLSQGLGAHWVSHYNDLNELGVAAYDFEGVGLFYGGSRKSNRTPVMLKFSFPYVRTPYEENRDFLLSDLAREPESKTGTSDFKIVEQRSALKIDERDFNVAEPALYALPERRDDGLTFEEALGQSGAEVIETYCTLFEPLFSLPLKLPSEMGAGHVPFIFVLFRLMRPRVYVELGVGTGSTFIAAATASRAYQTQTVIHGFPALHMVEMGGKHAESDGDLERFIGYQFPEVTLGSATAEPASYADGAIDVLQIGPVHSREALKRELARWHSKLACDGVVLINGTAVKNDGRGVSGVWEEVFPESEVIEFFHARGLCVVLREGAAQRLLPLVEIFRSKHSGEIYRYLISDISSLVSARMNHLEGKCK